MVVKTKHKTDVEGVGGPEKVFTVGGQERPFAKFFYGESRTKQAYKDSVDINNIVRDLTENGVQPEVRQLLQGDFTQATDLQDMMNKVKMANDEFASLPAEVRKEFGHDPVKLLRFMADSKNYERAFELGLLEPEKYQKWKDKQPKPADGKPSDGKA